MESKTFETLADAKAFIKDNGGYYEKTIDDKQKPAFIVFFDLKKALFEAMRNDLETMSEYGDDEKALWQELNTADDDILEEYKKVFIGE